jgi:hypothetical protein
VERPLQTEFAFGPTQQLVQVRIGQQLSMEEARLDQACGVTAVFFQHRGEFFKLVFA